MKKMLGEMNPDEVKKHNKKVIDDVRETIKRMLDIKKMKVLDDLYALAKDIEEGRAEVVTYKYEFGQEKQVDYGECERSGETIVIEFDRMDVG